MKFLVLLGSIGIGFAFGWMPLAEANVVPDATLSQPSRVTASNRTLVITAGTRRGRNLFHSFRQFSVKSGEVASFQGVDDSITNVFARVTGSNRSQINGTIEVLKSDRRLSAANLFLLNPQGIIFGETASLRVGGSFMATTANQINFADGTEFSAIRPQSAPLLSVSVPTGLQFGDRPGPIVNRSQAYLLDDAGNRQLDTQGYALVGLVGSPNQTLALVGGNITLTGGSTVRVEGGRIEVGSVAAGEVILIPNSQGWQLDYANVPAFSQIRLLNQAQIDASGAAGGPIQIQADRLSLEAASFVFSESSRSSQPGGELQITTADSILVGRNSVLSTSTFGPGSSGDISLSTRNLLLQAGGQIGSNTNAQGGGGNVAIYAAEAVTVAGPSPSTNRLSLLYAQTSSSGRAGNLTLETDRLSAQAGGQISATTFATGRAGNISIRANRIDLTGVALDAAGNLIRNERLPVSSGLFVGAEGSTGNGGSLNVETQQLNIREGALLQANTYSGGNAGNINVWATDSIEVSGVSEQSELPARITATSGGLPEFSDRLVRSATGAGGNLNIRTPRLTVENGGIISVNSRNRRAAGAGNINIRADQIALDDQGELNAQTESGDNAGIQLSGVDLLTMRRDSNISTSAGLNSGGGNGGDINVDTQFILSAPGENSDITANAGAGNGGNIGIAAQGILGLTQRNQRTLQSDITATSESGVDGEISISNPTIDPTQGVVELPSTLVDASQLIAQGCRAGRFSEADRLGEFIITGRGGLPASPTDLRSSEAVITDWVTVPQRVTAQQRVTAPQNLKPQTQTQTQPPTQAPNLIGVPTTLETSQVERLETDPANFPIEAQGWQIGQNGEIVLVAQAAEVTPQAPTVLPACLSQSF